MDLLSQIQQEASEVKASDDIMKEIRDLVAEGAELEETIESLNEALKAQNGRYNRIKQFLLPEAMKRAQLGEFKTPKTDEGQIKVKMDNYVSGSLPKEEHDRVFALEYLAEVGGQSLIKNQLSVDFSKGEDNAAKSVYAKVLEMLKEFQIETEPELKEGVHAQSLQAFGRQKLKAGEAIDLEKLGLASGTVCKFEFLDANGKKKKKKATEE